MHVNMSDVVVYLDKYTQRLQEVIVQSWGEFPEHAGKVSVKWGTKFYKVIVERSHSRSVHAFIDRTTGQLFKPASWHAPSKTTNYNIVTDFDTLEQAIDPFGGYLYKRNPLR